MAFAIVPSRALDGLPVLGVPCGNWKHPAPNRAGCFPLGGSITVLMRIVGLPRIGPHGIDSASLVGSAGTRHALLVS